MTRELGFQEILSNAIDYYTANMYTSMPGIVISVNMDAMRVDVQPALNIRNEDGDESIPRPVIINVPLQLPVSDLGGLTFPISAGCPVELRWSMRGLDKWKRGNGMPDSPSDLRTFDIRDCIATPGIYPLPLSKNSSGSRSNAHSPNDVVLVHNIGSGSEVEIRLKPNGDVLINSPTKVTINCQDAEINADSSTKVSTGDFTVESSTFTITTGTYAMTATDSATSTGNLEWSGDITLNGTSIDGHDHGNVQNGPGRTSSFGS